MDDPDNTPVPLLVWIDDAAAASAEAIKTCPFLPAVCCTARHRMVTLILCSHSLSAGVVGQMGVLSPWTRHNTSYIAIMRVGNAKLIQGLYDELASLVNCTKTTKERSEGRGPGLG